MSGSCSRGGGCNASIAAALFFPLDDGLRLLPNQQLTPRMEQCAIRMGLNEPFRKAAGEMEFHHRMDICAETIRTRDKEIGQVYEQLQAHHAEHLPEQACAERMFVSVDAAKVQTTTGDWRDVKTLVIGKVEANGNIQESSHFSRMCEYTDFAQRAQVEVKRRKLRHAQQVVAVHDGADWIPHVIDACRPDALRVLDFFHAAEHLAEVGRSVFGEGTHTFKAWFGAQRHDLRHGQTDSVLQTLSQLAPKRPEHAVLISDTLRYFTKRHTMIQYADFKAKNWPIGSGPAETAHKTVLHARMKRAGMRWSEANINPFVAARNLLCNNRWQSDWPLIHALRLKRPLPPQQPDLPQKPSLPFGFALLPMTSWRNQPVGKAPYQ